MNILFITLADIRSIYEFNIYTDLMREFVKNGHEVYIASPAERRTNIKTALLNDLSDEIGKHVHILKIRTGNLQKTNIIEKGISTILLEYQLTYTIKHYFVNVKFDLVLYSTPPVTLIKPIKYIKSRDNSRTYLMLKDIFPQNAVDLGMLSKTGIKGIIYKHFRRKEEQLYSISDTIGCMSQANVDYILKHNPKINKSKVEICPNSIEVIDKSVDIETRKIIRDKYNIPQDKKVFVYGGNLGKPQGISFFVECLRKCKDIEGVYFLIIGSGTEYHLLDEYVANEQPQNVKLMGALPKEDYDTLVGACDVGMIFLDYRFTIPNFPSRLLSYMQAKIPVLAVTDTNTDVGQVIVNGRFGWWCESNDVINFQTHVHLILESKTDIENEFYILDTMYSVHNSYNAIINSVIV